MSKITRDTKCGIFNTRYTAKIDNGVIKLTSPFIKWVDNSGNLAFANTYIRDAEILAAVHTALNGDYPDADSYGDGYEDAEDFIFRTILNQ